MTQMLESWFLSVGLTQTWSFYINKILLIAVIFFASYLTNFLAKKSLFFIGSLTRKTKTKWDETLFQEKFFLRLAQITPAIVVYASIPLVFPGSREIVVVLRRLCLSYMIGIGILVVFSIMNTLVDIYSTLEIAKSRPIKGYIQFIKVFVFLIGGILIVTTLINKSPLGILGGVGATTAILLLVFKDSILGFVAGFQLSANKMIKIGDWIEVKKYDANGFVVDITLQTIKVQNWDKTITMIPVYTLISDSFINWQGMLESGGRKIQRSLNIDMNSVKFCTAGMVEKFKKIEHIKDYMETKQKEIDQYNKEHQIDTSVKVNGRRMTNLGTFRAYIASYLRNHPSINKEMFFVVRHLQPGPQGLPIEIYVFSKDKAWANYEAIQADIFDHLLAVVPEFELRIYQEPSGHDLARIAESLRTSQSN